MVMTRKLTRAPYSDFLRESGHDYASFCIYPLKDFVEVPEAECYWLEAQAEQWPDGSGSRVKIRINTQGWGRYWDEKRNCWESLLSGVTRYLKKLGCTPGGEPKTIYFCLRYQKRK